MNDDQIINKKFHILQRQKLLKDNDKFIYNELSKNHQTEHFSVTKTSEYYSRE